MSGYSWTIPSSGGSSVLRDDGPLDRELGRFFGTDIYFRNDYSVTSAGDYLLVSGLKNLREAIYRRLITRPGEYKHVPSYGVGLLTYLKKPLTNQVIDELRTVITEQLLQERRIETVAHVGIEKVEGGVKIGLIVRAAGRALRFRPFTFAEEK